MPAVCRRERHHDGGSKTRCCEWAWYRPTSVSIRRAFSCCGRIVHLDKSSCSITCYAEQLGEDRYTARFKALADEWRPTMDQTP